MASQDDLNLTLLTSDTDYEGGSDRGDGKVVFKKKLSKTQNGSKRNISEQIPLIARFNSTGSGPLDLTDFDDREFASLIQQAELAIDNGINPERIVQGSSGSYFVKNIENEVIGVFKPKDEEPYGPLNPKWTKWFHKTCCPCCFGRGCIVAEQGYLSEAGASLVDKKLGLNIVPPTKVVYLASESFYYPRRERWHRRVKQMATEQFPDSIGRRIKTGLRPKAGSFQKFVKGYKDAVIYLDYFQTEPIDAALEQKFQVLFEKLVILDYVIRNTDRSNENWLIKYERPLAKEKPVPEEEEWMLISSTVEGGDIQIAAIDNGLAFPFKHPDQWRTYPFYWAWTPMAKKPFSNETIDDILPKLEDDCFVESIVDSLQNLFKKDKHFDSEVFEGQMGVMRGQICNLVKALRQQMSPQQLVDMQPISIEKVRESRTKRMIQKLRVHTRRPLFKDW